MERVLLLELPGEGDSLALAGGLWPRPVGLGTFSRRSCTWKGRVAWPLRTPTPPEPGLYVGSTFSAGRVWVAVPPVPRQLHVCHECC